MRAKAILLFFFLFWNGYNIQARNNDLEFLIEKIKLDYPVYKEKTRYINFDSFVLQTVVTYKDTFKAMAVIVDFFKDRHLDLVRSRSSYTIDTAACGKDYKRVIHYLDHEKLLHPYEGFWVNDYNNCIIALRQESSKPLLYKAYVIASRDSSLLYPGMVGFDLEQKSNGQYFGSFISGYTGSQFYVTTEFRNDSLFITGANSKWRRLKHYSPALLKLLPAFNKYASGVLLDKDNYLISIPGNTELNTVIVDSIVKRDYQKISSAKKLIIDLRNNLGGTTRTYGPLMPFIYTGPIARTSAYVYCTEDGINNELQQIDAYRKSGEADTAFLKEWLELVAEKKTKIGAFIAGNEDTLSFDTVMAMPQQVAILINYACQSAAEMMLLECRQSKKVTLFGEHTMGAIDQLNYFPIELPSKKYKLLMATGKRKIPPGGSAIDGKGIYPDVPLSDHITDWIDFVKTYYEKY
jgi:hypothetical protein